MSFNRRARLDTSQVEDRRGRGPGRAIAIGGGGGLGLIIMLVVYLLGGNPADVIDITQQAPAATQRDGDFTTVQESCATGADASEREDCRIVGFVNSIQTFWADEFARQGGEYSQANTVLFTEATEAACGSASAAMGPFYCPLDQKVYLDLTFFNELESRFGAQGGPFAEAYVLAHEYGHHIQNLSGILDKTAGSRATGPQSTAVQVELQADCLAGVWAYHATETGYLTEVTDEQIIQALDAAAAVGDDQIQRQTQGYVSPESWTHGSSAQRQEALKAGLQSGDLAACQSF